MPNTIPSGNQNSETNFSYLNVLRSVVSPLTGMTGLGFYYGQKLSNPMLSSINSLFFTKKTVADILNLNQFNIRKNKYINSSHKILLGLGTIGLANYAKFVNEIIEPSISTTTTSSVPTISTPTPNITTNSTEWELLINQNNNSMEQGTYISLNLYGAGNILSGITELLPEKFNVVKKVTNSLTAGALIGAGVVMGEKNGYDNCYSIPTIISGINDIANQIIPLTSTTPESDENEILLSPETTAINYYESNDSTHHQTNQDQLQQEQNLVMTM